jgi:hypothetical protein
MTEEHLHRLRVVEGYLTSEELEQDHTESIDVASGRKGRAASCLFWRYVSRCAQHPPRLCSGERSNQCLGDAEVSHYDIASLVANNVAGLQVSVDEVATMGIIKYISQLQDYLLHRGLRHKAALCGKG